MEGVCELLHAFVLQLLGDLIVVDAYFFKRCKFGPGLWNVVLDGAADPAMIAEVLDGFQWHGVDGIRANEFLGVEHVAVCRIFRAGAGPKWSLHVRATMFERLVARSTEDAFELLIDEASVSDSRLA